MAHRQGLEYLRRPAHVLGQYTILECVLENSKVITETTPISALVYQPCSNHINKLACAHLMAPAILWHFYYPTFWRIPSHFGQDFFHVIHSRAELWNTMQQIPSGQPT